MDPNEFGDALLQIIQEQQQLDVDAEPFGALLLDEVRDVGARDEVDVDVLILVAAALADPAHAVRADEREAFRQHAGRRVKFAEPLDPVGGEAGLLLELLDRGAFDRGVRVLVADQAGGKLDAAAVRAARAAGRPGSPCPRVRRGSRPR